jgi:hypothetical protein
MATFQKDPSTDIFSHQFMLDHQGHFSNKMEFEVAAFSVNLIAAKLVQQAISIQNDKKPGVMIH